MLQITRRVGASQHSIQLLSTSRMATSIVEQRRFGTHHPHFERDTRMSVDRTKDRFAVKFDRRPTDSRPLFDTEGLKNSFQRKIPGRNRDERPHRYGDRDRQESSPRRSYDRLDSDGTNGLLDELAARSGPDWASITTERVPFNYQPTTVPSTKEIQEYLVGQGIRFHGSLPERFSPMRTFDEAPFSPSVKEVFKAKEFVSPTPVQSVGWPLVMLNKDVIGIAETGSGKTLSFMLPLAEHIKIQPPKRRSAIPRPKGLVLAPTRELAQQIQQDSRPFLSAYGFRGTAVFGGALKGSQIASLRNYNDYVVGTPGRLLDLIRSHEISMESVSFAVFDEADRMLDMGFEPQIRQILKFVPPSRQMMMWSATWPQEVQSLAHDFTQSPVRFSVGTGELVANKKIEQKFIFTNSRDAPSKLIALISQLNPSVSSKVLIFCSTKRSCEQLNWALEAQNIASECIHGDKTQRQREKALQNFKNGSSPILIASDVASRGLDVKDITTVINYEMATNAESYVHRIGRTARGGNTGTAITFFRPEDADHVKPLISVLRQSGQEIPSQLLEFRQPKFQYSPRRRY